MKPFTYEVRRTLTSKFVVLLMVAIIGLSALLAYESAVNYNNTPITSRTPAVSSGYFFTGSNATIVAYAYDPFGSPYPDLKITYQDQGTSYGVSTGTSGYANVTVPVTSLSPISVTMNYSYTIFGTSFSSPKVTLSISPLIPYTGYSIAPGIISSRNNSDIGYQIFYVGPNGTSSPLVDTYVAPYSVGETGQQVVDNSTYSVSLSGFTVATVFPDIPSGLLNRTFGTVIQGSGGIFVHPSGPLPYYVGRLSIYTPMTQSTLQTLVLTGIGTTLGLLIPILGIFTAYLTYGKDRQTGVLESVIKRPVTRQGLITSRFLANSVSIGVAVLISMLVGDLVIRYFFNMDLTLYFSLFFIWTYIVEGLSFLALMYMFSHIVRSQGALLGVAIALFIVMDIFWLIIPAAVLGGFGVSRVSSTYIYGNVAFGYASPAGYGGLVQFLFTNHVGLLSTATVNPAAYGVTAPILIVAGILWIMVPFTLAYYLSRKYD